MGRAGRGASALVLISCLGATDVQAPENTTAGFLGQRDRWVDAGVELQDVQGLFGGRNVWVSGSGAVLVQIVKADAQGLRERRYARLPGMARTGSLEQIAVLLLDCAIRSDFVSIRSDNRPGIPDQARIRIVLRNAEGASVSSAFWEGTPELPTEDTAGDRARFDALYREIRKVQADSERAPYLVYEGLYQPGAWEKWVQETVQNLAWEKRAAVCATNAEVRGWIRVSGGCEVRSKGTLSWETQGAEVKLTLKNDPASEFFTGLDGTPLAGFDVVLPRSRMEAFLSNLKAVMKTAGPNDHPSSRGARLEMEIHNGSGAPLRAQMDELRGEKDIDPVLEALDDFARSCEALARSASRSGQGKPP